MNLHIRCHVDPQKLSKLGNHSIMFLNLMYTPACSISSLTLLRAHLYLSSERLWNILNIFWMCEIFLCSFPSCVCRLEQKTGMKYFPDGSHNAIQYFHLRSRIAIHLHHNASLIRPQTGPGSMIFFNFIIATIIKFRSHLWLQFRRVSSTRVTLSLK